MNRTRLILRLLVASVPALVITACGTTDSGWKKTNMPDSIKVPFTWTADKPTGCPQGQLTSPTVEKPQYPRTPSFFGTETPRGRVILVATIAADGTVINISAFAADDGRLIPPSVTALKLWRFKPALCGGAPIPIPLKVAFYFGVAPRRKA